MQTTQVSVLMINDKGIMLSVKGNDYFISYNRIPWMKNACISDALDVQMSGRNAIEWPKLDVDLEIESLKHPERYPLIMNLKSASNLNGNLNCSKELEHYSS